MFDNIYEKYNIKYINNLINHLAIEERNERMRDKEKEKAHAISIHLWSALLWDTLPVRYVIA